MKLMTMYPQNVNTMACPPCLAHVFSVLEEVTGALIIITEVRVEQTDDGSVDTTG